MTSTIAAPIATLAAALVLGHGPASVPVPPDRFGIYYPEAPCPTAPVDRSFSQFQVNLAPEEEMLSGGLAAGKDGEAVLVRQGQPPVRLVSNASRADWLLSYPLLMDEVGIFGRGILRPDCTPQSGSFYVEAIYPPVLIRGPIDSRVDLMRRADLDGLQRAVRKYGNALDRGMRSPKVARKPEDGKLHQASSLAEELFEKEAAMAADPWRARLLGDDGILPESGTVDVLLSGSDGTVGVFGHIAVGVGGTVYNVYPKGSDRGVTGPVHIADYLFNAQRGHALRRPTWILRLEGVPREKAEEFETSVKEQISDLVEGRTPYHPTANNCTIVSLKSLDRLGFHVARARYFARRFPRPAFTKILSDLPHLVSSGKLQARRIELIYVPQVPVRPSVGGAPNRPLRDRSKVG